MILQVTRITINAITGVCKRIDGKEPVLEAIVFCSAAILDCSSIVNHPP